MTTIKIFVLKKYLIALFLLVIFILISSKVYATTQRELPQISSVTAGPINGENGTVNNVLFIKVSGISGSDEELCPSGTDFYRTILWDITDVRLISGPSGFTNQAFTPISNTGGQAGDPDEVPCNVGASKNYSASRQFDTSSLANGTYLFNVQVTNNSPPGTGLESNFKNDNSFTVDHGSFGTVCIKSNINTHVNTSGAGGYSDDLTANITTCHSGALLGSYTATGSSIGGYTGPTYSPNQTQTLNVDGTITFDLTYTLSGGGGPVCGNGVVESGEACDTGGSNGSCPATCSTSCTSNSCGGGGPVCGNGIVESGEACDAGGSNGSCPATCSTSCTSNSCGGGTPTPTPPPPNTEFVTLEVSKDGGLNYFSSVSINPGNVITLRWDSAYDTDTLNADSCVLNWAGLATYFGSRTLNPGPASTTSYTATCTAFGQQVQASVTVTVVPLGCQGNCATFVNQNIPTSLFVNQTVPVWVTMQNTGTTTWIPGNGDTNDYRLGSQLSPILADDFEAQSYTPKWVVKTNIPPGGSETFSFNLTAPSTPGVYKFGRRMVQELVEWFGDYTPVVNINVVNNVCNGGVDIGLRLYQDGIRKVAVEAGAVTSPLRIYKDGIRGVVLVDLSDPNASKMHIQSGGVTKALCLLP